MTYCNSQQLAEVDPFRRLDWRWRAADPEEPGPARYSDEDAACRRIAAYRALVQRTGGEPTASELEPFSALHHAAGIREEDGPAAWAIEARLIAEVPRREIARSAGVAPEVIEAYAAAFFDLRGRYDARSWLYNNAVLGRMNPAGGLSTGDVWRWVAFGLGPIVLEEFIVDFYDPEPERRGRLNPTYQMATLQFCDPACPAYAQACLALRRFYQSQPPSRENRVSLMFLNTITGVIHPDLGLDPAEAGHPQLESELPCSVGPSVSTSKEIPDAR